MLSKFGIFPLVFGILCQEKSGNPGAEFIKLSRTKKNLDKLGPDNFFCGGTDSCRTKNSDKFASTKRVLE
jgi:hypothetical protein